VTYDGTTTNSPTNGAFGDDETISVGDCPPPPPCDTLIVNLTTDNFGGETSFEIIDQANNSVVASGDNFASNTTYSLAFCIDQTRCYDFVMSDAFGDGICCSFGIGNYSYVWNGVTTVSPSGGAFGSSETTQFGSCGPIKAASAGSNLDGEIMITAYPNPASNNATFKFTAPESGNTIVTLYTLTGNKVAELFNGEVEAGVATTADYNTSELPAGIYIYRVFTNSASKSGKLQIVH
jgi:hypothetical protein